MERIDRSLWPTTRDIIAGLGDIGRRLVEIQASEGASGNISVLVGWNIPAPEEFNEVEEIDCPISVPELSGASFFVTGSGRRLRELDRDPLSILAFVTILEGGKRCLVSSAPQRLFERPTSEFNSHLSVHAQHVNNGGKGLHTVVHAQPLYLTYLSHIEDYRDELTMNRRILRWQPETMVTLPEGIGVLPFLMPGSEELRNATTEKMKDHRIVLWSCHGVMTRSNLSIKRAVDLIEYVEAAAHYEYLNLSAGNKSTGLADTDMRRIADSFGKTQKFF